MDEGRHIGQDDEQHTSAFSADDEVDDGKNEDEEEEGQNSLLRFSFSLSNASRVKVP